jgi:hypothetical protein
MTAAVWKLIAAFALAWMPIGMSPASAAALSPAAAAAMADHCAGSDAAPHSKSTHSADCTGCVAVAALPARVDQPSDAPAVAAYSPHLDSRTGLHAETSTPPPKVA